MELLEYFFLYEKGKHGVRFFFGWVGGGEGGWLCRSAVEGSVCKNKAVRGRGCRCSKVTEYGFNMTHVACWP